MSITTYPVTTARTFQHPRRQRGALVLSPELRAALRELATAEGLTLSALVSVLVNEALDRRLAEHRHA
jgi:CopG-like RHH_1 or ribbon-helix-helix domain, RHH_5